MVSIQRLCLEIQLITSLNSNLSLDAKLSSTFDLLYDYHFVFVMQKSRKRLPLTSILARHTYKHYECVSNVGDGNFRPSLFYKKQYLSNGQASCHEISDKHIKYMAFHDTKKTWTGGGGFNPQPPDNSNPDPRLTNGEIISEEFQPMWSQSTNVTDEQTDDMRSQDRALH